MNVTAFVQFVKFLIFFVTVALSFLFNKYCPIIE